MPASLRYFKRDPNGLRRGEGIYYHRGKGYYSRYDVGRDSKIKAKGFKKHKTGVNRKGKGSSIAQAGDGILSR